MITSRLAPRRIIPKETLKEVLYLPAISSPTMKQGSYEDFTAQVKRVYGDISAAELLKKVKDHLINRGKDSKAYTIPGVEDYVVLAKKLGSKKEFTPLPNNCYGHNIGQPIAENQDGIKILLRNYGEPHSLKDWHQYLAGKKQITPKHAKKFIDDLKAINDFPQASFDDLAKRIGFCFNKLHRLVDSCNPNNFLIDFKKKQINFVDTKKFDPANPPLHWTFQQSIFKGLTDRLLNEKFKLAMTPEQRKECALLEAKIKVKCDNTLLMKNA